MGFSIDLSQSPFASKFRPSEVKSRASGLVSAAEAIGSIERGSTIVGVTKGSFSMLDMIEHVLNEVGPSEVDVSTWTMGVYDADVMWRFAHLGTISRIRFLLDPSMFRRRPDLADAFVAAFGGDTIRGFDNHAKFTLIGNADRKVVITSSMNLNRNKRLENFVIFDNPGVYDFHRRIVDRAFEQIRPHETGRRYREDEFENFMIEHGASGREGTKAFDDSRAVW